MGVRSWSGATRDAALPDSGHPVVLEQRFRFLEPVQEQKSEGFSHVQGLLLYWQYFTIKIQNSFAFPIVQFYFHVQLLQSNNNSFLRKNCACF
jgi:hypothetical protein